MSIANCSPEIAASIVLYRTDPVHVIAAARSVLSSALHTALVCIDNSPDDALRATAERAGAEYVFSGANRGFGAGHNLALRRFHPSAPYRLVLNPDVQFAPAILPVLYDFMQPNPAVGLVMPRVLFPDGHEQPLCKLLPSPLDLVARRFGGDLGRKVLGARLDRYQLTGMKATSPRRVPSLSGCFMLLRTRVIREVGLFDERYFMYMEDIDLCRRIGLVSSTVFYPGVSITHGFAKGSYKDTRLLGHHVASACRYFCKWGWFRDDERRQLNAKAPIKEQEGAASNA